MIKIIDSNIEKIQHEYFKQDTQFNKELFDKTVLLMTLAKRAGSISWDDLE